MNPLADPEFRLVCAAVRWPHDEASRAAVREAAKEVDWDRFSGMAHRHRVSGLVHRALADAGVAPPAAIADTLAQRAEHTAQREPALARESARLQALFDQAGVPNLILKGSTVTTLAYQGQTVKLAWDIDIVTEAAQVATAARILAAMGYRRVAPEGPLTEGQFDAYVRYAREFIFNRRADGINVEVKWALDQNPELLRGLSPRSPSQLIAVGEGLTLRTLAPEPLFAYLCVHGVRHAFARLKWLADIAAILAAAPPGEAERLHTASKAYGADRCVAVSLMLCHRLLATPLDDAFRRRLEQDRPARWLVDICLHSLTEGGAGETNAMRFANPVVWVAHYLLGASPRFVASELARKWASPHDRLELQLPAWAEFLYPIIRIPRSLGRRIGELRARAAER